MPDFHISRIRQIALVAKDVKRATTFYREVLELPFLFEAPPNLAFFDCGGVRLMVSEPSRPEYDHPSSILYFLVDDIQAAYRTLVDKGVRFMDKPHLLAKMPDHDLWLTEFRDTEGNAMALMSEVRAAASPSVPGTPTA